MVLLPDPDSPTSATVCPAGTSRSSPFSTRASLRTAYVNSTPVKEIA
eukprot:CAMPEP_0169478632 /NCGR_PEP_ID=MMETSP1042-20121227/28576_1 /TAXON_ID=464988 /ORGANISM="Hemiselmis andersenii, Strain CCMP1180" /LENGTH=46 /DNA_ID= /DNA_START= /DNA_END= /DNA_ORIENTATION=